MDAKTISLRVTAQEAAAIQRLAKALGVTQSDVLKQGIVALQNQLQEQRSSYELGEDVFGRHGSGRTGTSVRRRTMIGLARTLVEAAPRVRASRGAIDADVAAASMQGTLSELGRMIQIGVVPGPARRWHERLVALFRQLVG